MKKQDSKNQSRIRSLFFDAKTQKSIEGIFNGIYIAPENNSKKIKNKKEQFLLKIDKMYVNMSKDIEDKIRLVKDTLVKGKTKISITYIETIKLKGGRTLKLFDVKVDNKLIEKELEFKEAKF